MHGAAARCLRVHTGAASLSSCFCTCARRRGVQPCAHTQVQRCCVLSLFVCMSCVRPPCSVPQKPGPGVAEPQGDPIGPCWGGFCLLPPCCPLTPTHQTHPRHRRASLQPWERVGWKWGDEGKHSQCLQHPSQREHGDTGDISTLCHPQGPQAPPTPRVWGTAFDLGWTLALLWVSP